MVNKKEVDNCVQVIKVRKTNNYKNGIYTRKERKAKYAEKHAKTIDLVK